MMSILIKKNKINNKTTIQGNRLSKKLFFISFFILLVTVFFIPQISFATGVNVGLEYGDATGLSNTDPRIILARIIQIALGFLGILAVGLIMYGGFLWMTSNGDDSKIDNAKNILRNTVIGLIIILSAFAITTFLLNRILGATGFSAGGGSDVASGGGGVGVLGACAVENVYPESNQKEVPRNTAIIVTFKEEINSATICNDANGNNRCEGENIITDGRVKIYKTKDDSSNYITDVLVYDTADRKTFVFVPTVFLGSPSQYLWYTAYLSNDIEKVAGDNVFDNCRTDFLEWQFEVSNKIDLTPPQVKNSGVFPPPDDAKDTVVVSSDSENAVGTITINSLPNSHSPSTITAVREGGTSPTATAVANANNIQTGTLVVAVLAGGITTQLSNGNISLGTADFVGDTVIFPGILTLTVNDAQVFPNSWEIDITAMETADTITIGRDVYVFTNNPVSPNHILLGITPALTASNTRTVIDKRLDVNATYNGNVITIRAVVSGEAGNNIILSSSAENKIATIPMSGGSDREESITVNGKKDQPMNSVVQINFNEAVLPTTITGDAVDTYNTIRVVNNLGTVLDGGGCGDNTDCASFNCEAGACKDSSLAGEFRVSNGYRTVEFISNNQCGVNGCGEAIYCLPENSNPKIELVASSLIVCNNTSDCAARVPFKNCNNPGSSACQDNDGNNYPTSDIGFGSGVMDTAFNSLDGNRDSNANGPFSFFNENIGNIANGDNFLWSFFINNKMETTPPTIEKISPGQGGYNNLLDPIGVSFSKIMMSGSLRTGSAVSLNGTKEITHKALNIWSLGNVATGFWITKEDLDENLDGETDKTKALIKHSMLADATSYRAQVGSFIKDIYQNCFKPSDGVDCSGVTANNPSCCDGIATANLSADGNCP